MIQFRAVAVSSLLLLVAVLLGACQPKVYLMPTPVAFQSGEIDPFAINPDLESIDQVWVAYATNRLPVGLKADRQYLTLYDQTLRLGGATLRIGDEGQAEEDIRGQSTSERRKDRFLLSLEQVDEMAQYPETASPDSLSPELEAYFSRLNEAIDRSLHKELTVYVHGANNNFYRASAQAGQFKHFTGHNAVIMAFAWPSAASLLHYATDVHNARQTVPVFARLLELLARHSTARRINVLAYSAGAQVLSPALALLREQHADEDPARLRERLRLGEIYFAAADVDFRTFLENLNAYKGMVGRVTLAINMDDTVLGLAQGHHGVSRAGRPDLAELSEEESRWVVEASRSPRFDVIAVGREDIPEMGKGEHGFWYSDPWVSTDVLVQMLLHAPPDRRGLEEYVTERDASVWYFPPVYPERVARALRTME